MIDSEFIKSVVGGAIGGGISISTIPLLFKGDLLFKRELVAQDKAAADVRKVAEDGFKDRIAEQAESIEKLEAANARLENELREQFRTASEQTREILRAVQFLQSLAGLATSERRKQ